MTSQEAAHILQQNGLKRTKLRMALLRHFASVSHAQSYEDIKQAIAETDKSTLYRNLAAFSEAGLIHSINDHSGISKYAYGGSPVQGNDHAHFVCENCETVYCMDGLASPQINVPKGFKMKKVQTIVRGICADC